MKLAGFAFLAMQLSGPAYAQANLMYILDASNSMWGQIDSGSKIDTAKSVLAESLAALPEGVSPGLMIYGHRRKNDCTDVELVAPFGSATAADLKSAISSVTPRGKTPIATALETAGKAFAGLEKQNNSILLISDGIETCDGDPRAVAEALAQRGINLRVNVVGFDVDKKAKAQLQSIAKAGNGQYFDVRNAGDFIVAVKEIQKKVSAPKIPPPQKPPQMKKVAPKPKPAKLYFEDLFNGADLAPEWQVLNEDADTYLVENGVLTMVAQDGTAASYDKGKNVLALNKPIPKGNWTITVRLLIEPQTLAEVVKLGLVRDASNALLSSLSFDTQNYARTSVRVNGEKLARGKRTYFNREVYYLEGRNLQARAAFFSKSIKAVQLRLAKTGRNYLAGIKLEPVNPKEKSAPGGGWIMTQKLTSLKLPGNKFTLMFGGASNSYTPKGGEGLVRIDWLKIEIPQ